MTIKSNITHFFTWLGLLTFLTLSSIIQAAEVEVLHYWSSASEKAALETLKQGLIDKGHIWKDFTQSGSGGESTRDILVARIIKGNPPAAALIKGTGISRWARLGYLRKMDITSEQQNWDSILNPTIAEHMKFKDSYVAIPINIHRTNWVWSNKKLLASLGINEPTTWDEFVLALKKVDAAGKIPLVEGNEAWQHATLFEAIVASTVSPEVYRKVFVEHDTGYLRSSEFSLAFQRFDQIKPYLHINNDDTSWDHSIKQVMDGEAAFQIVGDWAKGEFTAQRKVAEKDYGCFVVPGSNTFLYNVDSLAIFELTGEEEKAAQTDLINGVFDKDFQVQFNTVKGSIPIRNDISPTLFDLCAQKSIRNFESAQKNNELLPSIAHGMATGPFIVEAFFEVVNQMVNDTTSENSLEYQKILYKKMKKAQYLIN